MADSGSTDKITDLVNANEQYARLVALRSSGPRSKPVNLQNMLRRMHQVVYQPEEFDPVLLFRIPPNRCHWRRQEVTFCRNKVDPQATRLQPFCPNHITSVQALEYFRAAMFLIEKNTAVQAVDALLATAEDPDPEPRTPRKKHRTRRARENGESGDENDNAGDDDGSGPGTPNRAVLAAAAELRSRGVSISELHTDAASSAATAGAAAATTATTTTVTTTAAAAAADAATE